MKKILLSLLLLTLVLQGCSQNNRVDNVAYNALLKSLLEHSVPELTVEEAQSMAGSAVFLDAREPGEYAVSHIAGARSVGYDHFQLESVSDLPLTDSIIVYCSVGYRSEKIAERLKAAGFQHIFNLYGGVFEWKNEGGEVVGPDGRPTDRVHAYDKTWGIWLQKGEKVYE